MAQEKIRITINEDLSSDSKIYRTDLFNYKIATGDKFWIPSSDLFLVVAGKTATDRISAERIFVVRLDNDNMPTEVTQLFVSQIVKKDHKTKKYIFDNELSVAHRLGTRYFKRTIVDKIIQAGNNKQYNAGVWDDSKNEWSKDEAGNDKIVIKDNAFDFQILDEELSREALDVAKDLLLGLYKTIPGISIT
jgi:hypothetical protein